MGLFSFILGPWYADKVFFNCLDNSQNGFDIPKLKAVNRMMQKYLLANNQMNSLFRSILYKELICDLRSFFLYFRCLLTIFFMFLYIPLAKTNLFISKPYTAALLYFLIILILSINEFFSSSMIKEGDKLILFFPEMLNWQLILAKYMAAIIETLPLIIASTILANAVLALDLLGCLNFGIALLLLNSMHLSLVILTTINFLHIDHQDMNLLDGIIYENTWANINSKLLMTYLLTLLFPVVIVVIFWLAPAPVFVNMSKEFWIVDIILLFGILFSILLSNILYKNKCEQLFK